MSLVLEIEFLTGVYRGTRSPASETPDWPPQPDRVFSALVSAWASRGERADERNALEWLEKAHVPDVCASDHAVRPAPACYVPPNDFRSPKKLPKTGGKPWKQALSTYPEYRERKERRFPATRPYDPIMMIIWSDEPSLDRYEALDDIARDVAYLGHSASLVRCRFLKSESVKLRHPRALARRRVYPGRLAELVAAHNANPVRPMIRPGASTRPKSVTSRTDSPARWLVLEAVAGETPDLRVSALVCRALRRALMSGYRQTASGDAIPEIISGHTSDQRPTRHPHLAVVPLAYVGYRHADSRLFGFALVPPNGKELEDVPGFIRAFEAVAPYDSGWERRVLKLAGPPLRTTLELAAAGTDARRSLSPDPYLKPSRLWASVTPIVLDRHLKRKGDREVREIIADACENVGLPRPDPDRIQTGKHSAVKGAPPARPGAGSPSWTRWKVPEPFATRSLVHVVIDFGHEKPSGPVLLGAGRFTGLGLCRGIGN